MALIGWWPLDGNTEDYTVNQNHGINNNVTWINGKIGQAGNFNGTNAFIELPLSDKLLNIGSTYTISMWFYTTASQSTQLISFRGGDFNELISLYISGQKLEFNRYLPSGGAATSTLTFALNQWNHIAVTLRDNDNQVDFYINGAKETISYTESYSGTTPTRITIGALIQNSSITKYLWGLLNDIRIYNHALSQKEINELAKAKVLHYTFNKNDGSVVYDGSGLKHSGTRVGTTTVTDNNYLQCAANGYVGSNFLMNPEEFTVSLDYKRDTDLIWNVLWSNEIWNNATGYFGYFVNAAGQLVFSSGGGGTGSAISVNAQSFTNPAIFNTYTFVKTKDTTLKIYINGILRASGTGLSKIIERPIRFNTRYENGGGSSATDSRQGGMRNIQVYQTALSDADILDLYRTKAKMDNIGNMYANEFVEDYEVAPGLTLTQLFEDYNDYVVFGSTETWNGITKTLQLDNSWILNGTATSLSERALSQFFGTTGLYYFNGMGTNDSNSGTRMIVWFNNSINNFQIFSNGESVLKAFDQPTQNNLRIWYNVTSGNTVSNMRVRPVAVNVSNAFGAGNEPTKAQLDAWYNDYSKVRIKQNGQVMAHELNEMGIDTIAYNGLTYRDIFETGNLLINGDFSDGTTGWNFSTGVIKSTTEGILTYQADSQYDSVNQQVYNSTTVLPFRNNLFYFSLRYLTNVTGNNQIQFCINDAINENSSIFPLISENNNFIYRSSLRTLSSNANQLRVILYDNRTSGYNEIKIDYVNVINLTARGLTALTQAQLDALYLKYRELKITTQQHRFSKDTIVINGEFKEI